MGTTLVAALLDDSTDSPTLWLAHVGDSRAYLFRRGALQLLTDDHSLVEEQVRAGTLGLAAQRRGGGMRIDAARIGDNADAPLLDVADQRRETFGLVFWPRVCRTSIPAIHINTHTDIRTCLRPCRAARWEPQLA